MRGVCHAPPQPQPTRPPTTRLGVVRAAARPPEPVDPYPWQVESGALRLGVAPPLTHIMSSGGVHLFDFRTPVPFSNVCSATGGVPRPPTPCTVIICVGDVWFFGIAQADGWWSRSMSPVQLPHLDSLRFVYGRGNTTDTLLAPLVFVPRTGFVAVSGA